ncbi:5-formyltetrahydrofolate cyclo-ligase [Auraticoccus cholistanensis]|nr:5-formyltetrahydrofolate cyclo-ligase [Auraticoccus cholistanensis]
MPPSQSDDRALAGAKDVLRDAVRRRRDARPAEQRAADDLARLRGLQELFGHPDGGTTVACYLSTGSEPSTTRLVAWLAAQDVRVLLPVLGRRADGSRRAGPDWDLYRGPSRLRRGPRGIPEPDADGLGPAALARASVVVVAALAATPRGDRLGTGGGWYDRALEHAGDGAVTVALLNDDEVMPTLPVQAWDRRVDVLATPTRLLSTLEER